MTHIGRIRITAHRVRSRGGRGWCSRAHPRRGVKTVGRGQAGGIRSDRRISAIPMSKHVCLMYVCVCICVGYITVQWMTMVSKGLSLK